MTLYASGGDSDSTGFAQQWPCCPWMPRTRQPFRVLGPGALPPSRCWCQRQSGTSLLRRVRLVKKTYLPQLSHSRVSGIQFWEENNLIIEWYSARNSLERPQTKESLGFHSLTIHIPIAVVILGPGSLDVLWLLQSPRVTTHPLLSPAGP